MKKIEAVIQSDRQKAVIDSIIATGVGGLTVTRSLGRGAGERPRIGGDKGEEIQYNAVDTIVTIVDDSKVESVLSAIMESGYTGTKGDGKIFISTVDDVVDIFSKEKGIKAL